MGWNSPQIQLNEFNWNSVNQINVKCDYILSPPPTFRGYWTEIFNLKFSIFTGATQRTDREAE